MTAVKEFFDNLESRADASKTSGMTNSYLFDIDGAGKWTVSVEDGKVNVTEGGEDADAVITTSDETFQKIISRRAEPDERLHDRQAQGQGRHGCCYEAAEAVLSRAPFS